MKDEELYEVKSREAFGGADDPGSVVNPDMIAFETEEAVSLLDKKAKVDDTLENKVCPGDVELVVEMPLVVSSL